MAAGQRMAGCAPGDSDVEASVGFSLLSLNCNYQFVNNAFDRNKSKEKVMKKNVTLVSHKMFGCRLRGVKIVVTNCCSASSCALLNISLSASVGIFAGRVLIGGEMANGITLGAAGIGVLTGRG